MRSRSSIAGSVFQSLHENLWEKRSKSLNPVIRTLHPGKRTLYNTLTFEKAAKSVCQKVHKSTKCTELVEIDFSKACPRLLYLISNFQFRFHFFWQNSLQWHPGSSFSSAFYTSHLVNPSKNAQSFSATVPHPEFWIQNQFLMIPLSPVTSRIKLFKQIAHKLLSKSL